MDDLQDFHFMLAVCDGNRCMHTVRGDDMLGMLALAHDAHDLGYPVQVFDTNAGVVVAASAAGCFGCEREHECGDELVMWDSPDDPFMDYFLARVASRRTAF
jgi:hypothetical protein